MKKLIAVLSPLVLIFSGCAADGTLATSSNNPTQQLGLTAIKVAINAKCVTEVNNLPTWKKASKVMTPQQQQSIQSEICGCVSEKAPQSVNAVDLATAAFDPQARTTIVSKAFDKTINTCISEVTK